MSRSVTYLLRYNIATIKSKTQSEWLGSWLKDTVSILLGLGSLVDALVIPIPVMPRPFPSHSFPTSPYLATFSRHIVPQRRFPIQILYLNETAILLYLRKNNTNFDEWFQLLSTCHKHFP